MEEDSHYEMMMFTKARNLRSSNVRSLVPSQEEAFRFTGKDWLMICLSQADETTKLMFVLHLWRAWYPRNDIIHHKGLESIPRSIAFLKSYSAEHKMMPQYGSDTKGKGPMFASAQPSFPLLSGLIKINSDTSFISQGIPSAAGAIARNHLGEIVLVACSPMLGCPDAEDAEAKAVLRELCS
ncbi:hypothetical protein QYE76_057006 [Lolium multiflorum]|uniref:RNase H type-1 domain-containing protein n=1 Tax=Lolium multiflorum TaxID=4521 RepID=A0AAD8T2K8_LOLMU|nr:hypothetical protein QYE76_057006 [Lolium multiflorum]